VAKRSFPGETPADGQRIRLSFGDCCVDGDVVGVVSRIVETDSWPLFEVSFENGTVINVSAFEWEEVP
jgi:hypothetical protein